MKINLNKLQAVSWNIFLVAHNGADLVRLNESNIEAGTR